jgi:hypothetical protein
VAGLHEQWPKTLNECLKLNGDYQARVHSGQMVLLVVRQGGWMHERWPKTLKEKSGNDFRQPSY